MPVLAGGLAAAAVGTGIGLYRMEDRDIPKVAILSSAFFAVSLVHIPVAGIAIHLVLSGLLGVLLGWTAFPAVLVALLLQKFLFHHGGLVSIGVNTTTMALPGILMATALGGFLDPRRPTRLALAGSTIGFGAVALSMGLTGLAFLASGKEFAKVAMMIAVAGLPLGLLEGVVTATVLAYLARVRPSLLPAASAPVVRWEAVHE